MHIDPHTGTIIHDQGFWQQTQCLTYEDKINNQIIDFLSDCGFLPTDNPAIFQKGTRRVVVSLVDDFASKVRNYTQHLPFVLNCDDVVITDNFVTCPTQYRVIPVPDSFFGIYYPGDQISDWQPDRDYSFSVNRLDNSRFLLMLELARYGDLDSGYVNFNCQLNPQLYHQPTTQSELRQNFIDMWNSIDAEQKIQLQDSYDRVVDRMPFRNYSVPHEQIHTRSFLNIVVETYSGQSNISYSEKIFRAMTVAVPWILHGATHAVSRLECLGFDCLSDIVDHQCYDILNTAESKKETFIGASAIEVTACKQRSFDVLHNRTHRAAKHNLDYLQNLAAQWPSEFENWKDRVAETLR